MEHLNNDQFWYPKFKNNLTPKDIKWEDWKQDERKMPHEPFSDWVSSNNWQPAQFPTEALMRHDPKIMYPNKVFDANPEVAKRQRVTKRPKDAPTSTDVDLYGEPVHRHTHESMRGTGVPEHVTVYRFGKLPKKALYGSGSVDPNWPEAVRTGWRSKDSNINHGPLHITLVPHEDILHTDGVEGEVFYRRGSELNKTKRTTLQQRIVKNRHESSWDGITNYPHRNKE